MSKTTRKTYPPKFKMAVAIDVVRGEKTLSQVAAEHGVSPSLAAEWRDELPDGADDVSDKTQQERERKRSEEAARRKYDEALPGELPRERVSCNLLVDSGTAGTGNRYALSRYPPTNTSRLER
ncbi:transposase [Atopobium sp. oral taxon 416]|uniref:transposase n=1 Tax=Atopobium sp. oral taxon 416 TaxID=712157 RepID=UPI001BA4C728|nr:transposase [Atopobium sp. oral taxon 416]QUC02524.1 transposase [Atopobium sp. oral taxon 416]